VPLIACAPSRAALIDPVDTELRSRTGLALGGADARARAAELLARPLDADAAARVALLSRPAVQAALEELGASGAELAAAIPLRRVELDLEVKHELDGDGAAVELAAMTDLMDLVTMPGQRGAARAELTAARARAVRTAIEIAGEARAALVRAVAAAQLVALRQTVVDAADASATLSRSLREAGNITELELLKEEALHEEARLDLAAAQLDLAAARAELAAALGLHGTAADVRTIAELGEPPGLGPELEGDLGQLEAAVVKSSLELAELRARAEAAAREVGLARWRSVLPELGAGVAAEREEGHWSLGPAVSVSLPLLDWGQAGRARAWAELRQVRELYRERAIALRAAARAAAQRLVAARERVAHLRDVLLPLRRRILEATLLQYNAMQASPFDLMAARQAEAEAASRLVEALREAHLAAIEAQLLRAGASPGPGAPAAGAAGAAAPAPARDADDH